MCGLFRFLKNLKHRFFTIPLDSPGPNAVVVILTVKYSVEIADAVQHFSRIQSKNWISGTCLFCVLSATVLALSLLSAQ